MTDPAPKGLGTSGRRLWRAVTADFELAEHEVVLLRQAVRVADMCDRLESIVAEEGPLVNGKTHPALVELRQQQLLLGRLIVALRVPIGDQEAATDGLEPTSGRLQRRGTRGFYGLRGGAA